MSLLGYFSRSGSLFRILGFLGHKSSSLNLGPFFGPQYSTAPLQKGPRKGPNLENYLLGGSRDLVFNLRVKGSGTLA